MSSNSVEAGRYGSGREVRRQIEGGAVQGIGQALGEVLRYEPESGQLVTIGATPAAVNAVVDALAASGLGRAAERVQMPLTAPTVWRALQGEFDEPVFD